MCGVGGGIDFGLSSWTQWCGPPATNVLKSYFNQHSCVVYWGFEKGNEHERTKVCLSFFLQFIQYRDEGWFATMNEKDQINALRIGVIDMNKDYDWGTPLIVAVRNNKHKTVQWLLKHKADINQSWNNGDGPYSYALLTAFFHYKDNSIIMALLDAKADTNIRTKGGTNVLHMVVNQHRWLGKSVETLMKCSCQHLLFERRANPVVQNVLDHDLGQTPIECASENDPLLYQYYLKEASEYKRRLFGFLCDFISVKVLVEVILAYITG